MRFDFVQLLPLKFTNKHRDVPTPLLKKCTHDFTQVLKNLLSLLYNSVNSPGEWSAQGQDISQKGFKCIYPTTDQWRSCPHSTRPCEFQNVNFVDKNQLWIYYRTLRIHEIALDNRIGKRSSLHWILLWSSTEYNMALYCTISHLVDFSPQVVMDLHTSNQPKRMMYPITRILQLPLYLTNILQLLLLWLLNWFIHSSNNSL